MVHAPNKGEQATDFKPSGEGMLRFLGIDRELRVAVGPPEASLRVWVIEPSGSGQKEAGIKAQPPEPKGTLIVLHGYRASAMWLRGMGKEFAEAGYRVVMVDLRGHGRSSGEYITYGVVESRDVKQVIDHLEREGLIAGKLGVWGISMGGATAIQLAAIDDRVQAVVAVAPYTSMRDAIAHGLGLLPVYGWMLSDEAVAAHLGAAGAKAGFDPGDADVVRAIRSTDSPVRIIHGKCDWIVPPGHGRKLHDAAPDRSDLVELGWTGHISAHFSGAVERESVEWFNRWLR